MTDDPYSNGQGRKLMPKLKPATQAARREHILDAAEKCFAEAGFHRTTMQDICAAAGVSAGALYLYFASKEDLIAGIVERDRAKLANELSHLSAAPDLMAALAKLADHYSHEEPHYKRVLNAEIGAEATRNPAVERIFRSVDAYALDSLEALFARAAASGKIAPSCTPRTIAEALAIMGDGLCWRRAIDPSWDPGAVLPVLMDLVRALLNPASPADFVPKAGADAMNQTQNGSEMTS
jgi:AcrR family transcriptional regulator